MLNSSGCWATWPAERRGSRGKPRLKKRPFAGCMFGAGKRVHSGIPSPHVSRGAPAERSAVGSAPGLGPGGREFESLRSDSLFPLNPRVFRSQRSEPPVGRNRSALCRGYAGEDFAGSHLEQPVVLLKPRLTPCVRGAESGNRRTGKGGGGEQHRLDRQPRSSSARKRVGFSEIGGSEGWRGVSGGGWGGSQGRGVQSAQARRTLFLREKMPSRKSSFHFRKGHVRCGFVVRHFCRQAMCPQALIPSLKPSRWSTLS